AMDRGRPVPPLPEILIAPGLDNTWPDTAEAAINNWIGKVYQITHHERGLPFKGGVNPADPLGLGVVARARTQRSTGR
ncbi:MAG TPA: homoserine O-succinyltransferase, partial [Chromatiales bacterium]|nr:homoserine O-succinyltransferase [Chromatiales bacterium]